MGEMSIILGGSWTNSVIMNEETETKQKTVGGGGWIESD